MIRCSDRSELRPVVRVLLLKVLGRVLRLGDLFAAQIAGYGREEAEVAGVHPRVLSPFLHFLLHLLLPGFAFVSPPCGVGEK